MKPHKTPCFVFHQHTLAKCIECMLNACFVCSLTYCVQRKDTDIIL